MTEATAHATATAASQATKPKEQGQLYHWKEQQVVHAAQSVEFAREVYDDYLRKYFEDLGELSLEEDRFWELLNRFSEFVRKELCVDRGAQGNERPAAEKFLSEAMAAENGLGSFEELVRFSNAYSKLQCLMAEKLEPMEMDKSDTMFGELCEGLPLAGRELVMAILDEEFDDYEDLHRAVRHQTGEWFGHVILNGENFLYFSLETALYRAYRQHLTRRKLLNTYSSCYDD